MSSRQTSIRLSGKTPPGWLGALAALAAVTVGALVFLPLKSVADRGLARRRLHPRGAARSRPSGGCGSGSLTALLSAARLQLVLHAADRHGSTIAAKHDVVALVVFVDRRRRQRHPGRAGAGARRRGRAPARGGRRGRWPSCEQLARRARPDAGGGDRGGGAAPQRRAEDRAAALGLPRPAHAADRDHRRRRRARLAQRHRRGAPRAERGGGRARASGSRAWSRTCSTSRGSSPAPPSRTASRSTLGEVLEAARRIDRRRRRARSGSRSTPSCRRCAPTRPSSSAPSPTCSRTRVVHGGGQPVLVRSRLVGPRLVVRVVDRGPGIPEAERERIFEPFYRARRRRAAAARASAWRSRGASSRPTAARSRSSRCPARARSFVVSFERGRAGGEGGGMSGAAARSSSATTSRRSCARCG